MFTFVVSWFTSRRYWLLPVLVPLGLAAVLGAKIAFEANRSRTVIMQAYLMKAEQAIKDEQWEVADLLLRRVLTIHPRQQKAQSLQATIAFEQGQIGRAAYWIRRVAEGYDADAAKANIWLASQALGPDPVPSHENLRTAVGYLERAREIQPRNSEIEVALAAAYVRLGLYEDAVRHYQSTVGQFPELYYDLARLYDQRGMVTETHRAASRAVMEFTKRLDQNPFDYESRERCAYCLALSWRYQEAIELLKAGLLLGEHREELRGEISTVYSAWYEYTQATERPSAATLTLLEEALRWNPRNMGACVRLMELIRDSQVRQQARVVLERSLVQGEASALSHLILGTVDFMAGDYDSASLHLEQARALDKTSPAVLNNLAFAMMMTEDEIRLKEALTVINTAYILAPDVPEIRETRGQILLRNGNYREALVELETVLPEFSRRKDLQPNLPALHTALAVIYDHLDQPGIADQHRDKVKELTNHRS